MLPSPVKPTVPLLVTGRASRKGTPLLTVIVDAGEIVSVPLPETTPPLQVMAAPVTVTLAVPPKVPPVMARVGIDCAEPLLTFSVPPATEKKLLPVPALFLIVPLLVTAVVPAVPLR